MNYKNIHFIVNPAAGQPRPILHPINSVLYPRGVDWTLSITQGHGSGKQQARRAVESGADLIVVYGGDGTVNDVLHGLIDTDVPLALLHGGTGNALAHDLTIPRDLPKAVELILESGKLHRVDVGKVTAKNVITPGYFLLRASVGLQTQIVDAATREVKDKFGNLAYAVASLRSLAESESLSYHLTIDGENISVQGLICMIANSAAVGGPRHFHFAPDVNPCDGMLDVFVFDTGFESIINGILEDDRSVFGQRWSCHEITVRTPVSLPITLDGEAHGQTPATISIVPQAVQILVPSSYNSE